MKLTPHAIERMKQRSGLHQSAMLKTAERAWQNGAHRADFSGSFARYLTKISAGHPRRVMRIYDGRIWIFAMDGTMITVLFLPADYRKAALRRLAEMKGGAQ